MISRSPRLAALTLLLSPLLLGGCTGSYEHEEVVSSPQGMPTIKRVADPVPPRPEPEIRYVPAPQTGPTAKEVDQQKRIDELEAKQKALQDEINRLKKDQANTPK
jgi:hypothetical protein